MLNFYFQNFLRLTDSTEQDFTTHGCWPNLWVEKRFWREPRSDAEVLLLLQYRWLRVLISVLILLRLRSVHLKSFVDIFQEISRCNVRFNKIVFDSQIPCHVNNRI